MTTKSLICRPLLALTALCTVAPLAAQEPVTVTGSPQPVYQERVSFTDLDLRHWSDRQALRSRVHQASERVCIQAEGPFNVNIGFMGKPSCTQATYKWARPQIASAIARAKSGQLIAMNLVISLPARAR